MMRVRWMILLLAGLLLTFPALADEPPEAMLAAFEGMAWCDWTYADASGDLNAWNTNIDRNGGSWALIALEKDNEVGLFLLCEDAPDAWRITESLVQEAMDIPYVYCEMNGEFELDGDGWTLWLSDMLGGWQINRYRDEKLEIPYLAFGEDGLLYLLDWDVWQYAARPSVPVEKRLNLFNRDALEQACAKLADIPRPDPGAYAEIPAPMAVAFRPDERWPVFTAPDAASFRAGRATVSTNGEIRVYGEENGWLMVDYAIEGGQRRIGYISAQALPFDTPVPRLNLMYASTLRLDEAVTLTDDPFGEQGKLITLPKGTQITCLATFEDGWNYVEAVVDGQLVRGFFRDFTINWANG